MKLEFEIDEEFLKIFSDKFGKDIVRDIEDYFFSFNKVYTEDPLNRTKGSLMNSVKQATAKIERIGQVRPDTRTYNIVFREENIKLNDGFGFAVQDSKGHVTTNIKTDFDIDDKFGYYTRPSHTTEYTK